LTEWGILKVNLSRFEWHREGESGEGGGSMLWSDWVFISSYRCNKYGQSNILIYFILFRAQIWVFCTLDYFCLFSAKKSFSHLICTRLFMFQIMFLSRLLHKIEIYILCIYTMFFCVFTLGFVYTGICLQWWTFTYVNQVDVYIHQFFFIPNLYLLVIKHWKLPNKFPITTYNQNVFVKHLFKFISRYR